MGGATRVLPENITVPYLTTPLKRPFAMMQALQELCKYQKAPMGRCQSGGEGVPKAAVLV